MSSQVTGSLSFIIVEGSNDEKTPKSYNKETKSIISRSMRLEDYGKSIIFRNKRYPRNPIHSNSDKFFNKVRSSMHQRSPNNGSDYKHSFLIKGSRLTNSQCGNRGHGKKKHKKHKSMFVRSSMNFTVGCKTKLADNSKRSGVKIPFKKLSINLKSKQKKE